MASKITIADVHPGLDGAYDFDETYLTNRELHVIKELSGLAAGEFEDAYARRDNDVVVCLAVIALCRSGKIASRTPWTSAEVDALWDAQAGNITIGFEDEDADALPPESALDSPPGDAESNAVSGSNGKSASEQQEELPSSTGSPRSVTGATSLQVTSGN